MVEYGTEAQATRWVKLPSEAKYVTGGPERGRIVAAASSICARVRVTP
jgi:hypothetical protein